MDRHGPLLAGVDDAHVQQFQQAVVVREATFGLGQFSKLSMHRKLPRQVDSSKVDTLALL